MSHTCSYTGPLALLWYSDSKADFEDATWIPNNPNVCQQTSLRRKCVPQVATDVRFEDSVCRGWLQVCVSWVQHWSGGWEGRACSNGNGLAKEWMWTPCGTLTRIGSCYGTKHTPIRSLSAQLLYCPLVRCPPMPGLYAPLRSLCENWILLFNQTFSGRRSRAALSTRQPVPPLTFDVYLVAISDWRSPSLQFCTTLVCSIFAGQEVKNI